MTTDTEALRAQFERQCRGLDLSRNEAGVYTDESVYVAWIHYRGGYAAAKAETAEQERSMQRDAERWRLFRQISILPLDDDHPLIALAERLSHGDVSVEDVDAAIDAAKGEQ